MIIIIIRQCKYGQLSRGFLLGEIFQTFQRSPNKYSTQGLFSEKVGGFISQQNYLKRSQTQSE